MVLLSSVYSTLTEAYRTKNWTYRDIASGHLAGNKVGRKFSTSKPTVGFFPWVSTVLDQASLYCKARDLGLFQKMPALRRPFIFGSGVVACINLMVVMTQNRQNKYTKNLIWNLTPKVNAVGLTAVAVCEFPKQPMKTATFFASGAASFFSRVSLGGTGLPWNASLWLARANIAWTGNWTDRALTAFKVVKTNVLKG